MTEKPEGPTTRDTIAPTLDASERCHVLIVDDSRDAADVLAMMIQMRGHTTDVAYGAAAAQAKARTRTPDVALLDLGMPQQDGITLARVFRADPALRSVRLVAVTGSDDAQTRARTAAEGFAGHVRKPADIEELTPYLVPSRAGHT
jgi:CheY-like chemotaxis protein